MTMEAISPVRRSSRPTVRARSAAPKKKAKSKAKVVKASATTKSGTHPKRAQAERLATSTVAKTSMLSFRMDVETRDLVDRAAGLAGQNRTDFMITVLREKAIDVILDRRLFLLNDTDWNAFTKQLDEPPAPNAKLKALLSRKPVWDQ